MRKLSVFNFITLNGFYKAPGGDISWHRHGAEENEYSADSLQADNILLFGRVTYEMMAGFWPTPMAVEMDAATAKGMNNAEKIVFSRTLTTADWENTTIINDDPATAVRKMKETPGRNMTLLGSGSIVTQLAAAGLIDNYQIMIDPVAIGQGTSIFNGLDQPLNLQLINSRVFKSGTILLDYRPIA